MKSSPQKRKRYSPSDTEKQPSFHAPATGRVGVVVPAFNAAAWLEEAVRSVMAQSFTDWQLVIVNDGSTDTTPETAAELAAEDPRISVVAMPNGGLAAARNRGLDFLASSNRPPEYITFLDADDALSPAALETLVQIAENTGAQIVAAGHLPLKPSQWERREQYKSTDNHSDTRILTPAHALEETLYQQGIDHSAWGKLYDAALWKSLRFRKGILYEDLEAFRHVCLAANAVAATPDRLYYYRLRAGSLVHAPYTPARAAVLDIAEEIVAQMEERQDMRLAAAAKDRLLSASFNMLLLTRRRTLRKLGTYPARTPLFLKIVTDPEYIEVAQRSIENIRRHRKSSMTNPKVRAKNRIASLVSYLFF